MFDQVHVLIDENDKCNEMPISHVYFRLILVKSFVFLLVT